MRWVTVVLVALLVAVQADLWLGRSGLPAVMGLRSQLAQQQAVNDTARVRNGRLAAEVSDLKDGLEMVEDKARSELGMVRPDEILVQLSSSPLPPLPQQQHSPSPPLRR